MKKKIFCGNCEQVMSEEYTCDTCGIPLDRQFMAIDIHGDNHCHFCTYKCAIDFLQREKNKEYPDNRFELGI